MADDFLSRHLEMLIGRWSGPLWLRFLVQPTVSVLLAVRAGVRDARHWQPPFLWEFIRDPARRGLLAREAWRDLGRLLVLAASIDVIYQIVEYRWVYPLQSVIVAVVLGIVPYVLVRGPVTRIARRHHPRT
jgi:hypothetical protein